MLTPFQIPMALSAAIIAEAASPVRRHLARHPARVRRRAAFRLATCRSRALWRIAATGMSASGHHATARWHGRISAARSGGQPQEDALEERLIDEAFSRAAAQFLFTVILKNSLAEEIS